MVEGPRVADAVDAYSPLVAAAAALGAALFVLLRLNPPGGVMLWAYVVGPALLVALATPCTHRRPYYVTSKGGLVGGGAAALGAFLALLVGVAIPPLFLLLLFLLPTLLAFLGALVGHG